VVVIKKACFLPNGNLYCCENSGLSAPNKIDRLTYYPAGYIRLEGVKPHFSSANQDLVDIMGRLFEKGVFYTALHPTERSMILVFRDIEDNRKPEGKLEKRIKNPR